jgi:hypothetical protein
MMAISSYEAMTGRSLPKDIVSVVQDQPNQYVTGTGDGGNANYTLKTTTRRTPKYGTDGQLTGYTVEVVDENGKVVSTNFESAQGPATGTDGKTSAYDMLTLELNNLGLSSLVNPLKSLFQQGITDSDTLRLKLSETPEYQTRFSANAERIKKGLTALTPAQYLAKEDAYQNIMRQYGLPASYYTKDSTGKQAGFDQLLSNDVSAVELEDRVMTAQNRVVNANPEVYKALKSFYPDITNGDILAYTLDPTKALDAIKRKVTAAEIGGAALAQGLTTEATAAENLAKYGVDKAAAQQGYGQIAGLLPRASMLSDIYGQGGYNQATAEAEVFNTAGGAEATAKRKKLSELEKSKFGGSSGTASNALSRDRAMTNQMLGTPGAGAF